MPTGDRKYYTMEPYSVCQILMANVLETNYKHMFDYNDQTFAWFAAYLYASERENRLGFYWS